MSTVIISGGRIEKDFVLAFLMHKDWERKIAVDKGLEFFYQNALKPTDIIGDFDSADSELVKYYEAVEGVQVQCFSPMKNASDTEIAVRSACETEKEEIVLLGATGTRLDHILANIQVLSIPLEKKIPCSICDSWNRITLHRESFQIEKSRQYGKYISFFSLGEQVLNLTLHGFAYPLDHYTVASDNSLCVSNEIEKEIAGVEFDRGILIMIESRD